MLEKRNNYKKFLAIALASALLLEIPSLTISADAVSEEIMEAQDSLQEVIDEVDLLVTSEDVNVRDASFFKRLLGAVNEDLTNEDCKSAILKLKRFDIQVDALVSRNRLSQDDGQTLKDLVLNVKEFCYLKFGFVPGEIIVQFKLDALQSEIDALISECKTNVERTTNETLDGLPQPLPDEIDELLRNVYFLKINRGTNEDETLLCFQTRPDLIETITLNLAFPQDSHFNEKNFPNDPEFKAGRQWSLINGGQKDVKKVVVGPPTTFTPGQQGIIDADIDVVQAWNLQVQTSSGFQPHTDCSKDVNGKEIIIAILDNGAILNHPDLIPNLWTNINDLPGDMDNDGNPDDDGNGYADDTNGFDFLDDKKEIFNNKIVLVDKKDDGPQSFSPQKKNSDHGTHVAGIIGAKGNNGQFISGICHDAQLMILKYSGLVGFSKSFQKAVLYLSIMKNPPFNHNIKVINISSSQFCAKFLGDCGWLENAYKTLDKLKILTVKSAGNTQEDLDKDIVGGVAMTAVNTPSVGAHPPIIYPSSPFTFPITAAAGIGVAEFMVSVNQLGESGGIVGTLRV